ncbi:MAG TPA: DUF58 domain-containing protein [Verrucomicrobiales bacterium]|nr:DUF58 domain-containing protein [Verrucomicrobiales bacterium]
MKWFVIAVLLLGLGLVLDLELLVFAMYVLLGVLLVSRWLTREWTGKVAATRTCSIESTRVGGRATITITLINRSRLAVPWLIIEEAFPNDALKPPLRMKLTGRTTFIARLKPRETRVNRYTVEFLSRGYHQFGPLLIEGGDVFGLHRRYRVLSAPVYVLVPPDVVPLKGYDIASRRPLGEIRMTHRLFEDPTRIAGVRPYQPGDPLSRIHWRAYARTGSLHSKVFEPSCVAGATLLLDFHRRSFTGSEAFWVEDLAITAAASLANAVYELGQKVGFVTNGRDAAERIRSEGWRAAWTTRAEAMDNLNARPANERLEPIVLPPQRGPEQLQRIHETLARLEMTDGFDFAEMVRETASRLPRDASVVAILPEVTRATATTLGELRRSGYAVSAVVVTRDEREFRDWAMPPDWAAMLIKEGIEFRPVNSREALAELQVERVVAVT